MRLTVRKTNPAAFGKGSLHSDRGRPPGNPTVSRGDESPMNSHERSVLCAYGGLVAPDL